MGRAIFFLSLKSDSILAHLKKNPTLASSTYIQMRRMKIHLFCTPLDTIRKDCILQSPFTLWMKKICFFLHYTTHSIFCKHKRIYIYTPSYTRVGCRCRRRRRCHRILLSDRKWFIFILFLYTVHRGRSEQPFNDDVAVAV